MKTSNPMLEKLLPILPLIAANAAQAESERKVPDENIRLLKSIGMHRVFQPKNSVAWKSPCQNSPTVSPRWPEPVAERPGLSACYAPTAIR